MKLDLLKCLFEESSCDEARKRLFLGCTAVVERSTWGQMAKKGASLTQADINLISEAMTKFITASLADYSDIQVTLSGDCYLIGCFFDPYVVAEQLSSDFLSESIHLSAMRITDSDPATIVNQATAALLFRYKYCFLSGEFFDVGLISQWMRLMLKSGSIVVDAMKFFCLLDLLESAASVDVSPIESGEAVESGEDPAAGTD